MISLLSKPESKSAIFAQHDVRNFIFKVWCIKKVVFNSLLAWSIDGFCRDSPWTRLWGAVELVCSGVCGPEISVLEYCYSIQSYDGFRPIKLGYLFLEWRVSIT